MRATRRRGLDVVCGLALACLAWSGGAARAQDPEPPSSQSEPERVPTHRSAGATPASARPSLPASPPSSTAATSPVGAAGPLGTALPAPAPAPAPAAAPALAALPKKDRDLADKRARQAAAALPGAAARLLPPIGAKPAPIINLFHRWTEEYLPIAAVGPLPPAELQNRLLRDHYTNQSTKMATRLIPSVIAAARKFGVSRIEIVSGYRHPKYNLILRKKGHQVARDSEHSHGSAVDFRLPGITTEKLAQWAHALRLGGVGTYLQSQFVHIDVGPVRRWSGE